MSPFLIIAGCAVLTAFFFAIDLIVPKEINSGVLYIIVVLLSLLFQKGKHTVLFACAASILLVSDLFLSPEVGELYILLANRFLVLFTIWMTTYLGLKYKRGQEKKAYLAAIVNSSRDAIVGRTLDGKITSWNHGAEQMYGFCATEMIGQPIGGIVPEDKFDEVTTFLRSLKQGEKIEHYETLRKRKNGELFYVSLSMSPIKDAYGQLIGVSTMARDITESKKAQEELEEMNMALSNAMPGIARIDPDGKFTYANEIYCRMVGRCADQLIGHAWYSIISDEEISQAETFHQKMLYEGKSEFVAKAVQADGAVLHQHILIVKRVDREGRFLGHHCFMRDISERIQTQENLKNFRDQLELEKMKMEQVLSFEEGLNRIVNIDKLIDFVIEKTTQILEAEKCSLMLVDENTRELCIRGHKGLDEELVAKSRIRIGEPVAGLIASQDQAVLVRDIEDNNFLKRGNRPAYQRKSFMIAPIKVNNHLMGVINVADKSVESKDDFSNLDLKILRMIVRQVAVSIETAKVFRELKYLTITDPLTNLYNYRHFARSLDLEIKRIRRFARALSVIFLDVDNFKSYNDSLGRLQGDLLLKEIGRVLNFNVRDVDIACRYAGDEFAVILPETDPIGARMVAEKIKKIIESLSLSRDITVSIGIASCNPEMDRYDLILKADSALKQAKKKGKERIHNM